MKPEVIEAFRSQGVPNQQEAVFLVKEAKLAEHKVFSRSQVVALEQKWRENAIQANGKCQRCPRVEKLTTDHVIPKVLLRDFGIDPDREFMPENLVLLCSPCNGLKSGRLDFSNPQTKVMLLKLLEEL